MKQAFHIFLKDLRRLWPQIALLMIAITYFAVLDIRYTPLGQSDNGREVIELIVGVAVWFLIARAVHEESLTGENQFWLTRPYDRVSLLGSKVMMAVFVVMAPMLLANCVIVAADGLNVSDNLPGLTLRVMFIALWLILPPFALATVTRSISEDILAWVVCAAIAATVYLPVGSVPFGNSRELTSAVAILLLLAALLRQYWRRGSVGSRLLIGLAIITPVIPMPHALAIALDGLGNDSSASSVSIAPTRQSISESEETFFRKTATVHCVDIPIAINGIHSDWRLVVLSQEDIFKSADGKIWSAESGPERHLTPATGAPETARSLTACIGSAELAHLGNTQPLAIQTSLVLGVIRNETPIKMKAQWPPFDVPGIGRCYFAPYFTSDARILYCQAAVWFPPRGWVALPGDARWSSVVANFRYRFAPLNLLPGMSPVIKWTTLPMDKQIRNAVETGGNIEFRPETQIAVIEREVSVKEVHFAE